MKGTIAEKLNIFPETKIIPFEIWIDKYSIHIWSLYIMFERSLENVEPFHQVNFFSRGKVFKKFALMLYKSSYAIL